MPGRNSATVEVVVDGRIDAPAVDSSDVESKKVRIFLD